MSTQLMLAPATRTWEQLSTAISESLDDLLTGSVSEVRVTVPGGGPVSYTHLTLPTICSV